MSERKKILLSLIEEALRIAAEVKARPRPAPKPASPERTTIVLELLEEGIRHVDAFRKRRSRPLRLVPRGL